MRNSVSAVSVLRCFLDVRMDVWSKQSLELRGEVRAGDKYFSTVGLWVVFKAGGGLEGAYVD